MELQGIEIPEDIVELGAYYINEYLHEQKRFKLVEKDEEFIPNPFMDLSQEVGGDPRLC